MDIEERDYTLAVFLYLQRHVALYPEGCFFCALSCLTLLVYNVVDARGATIIICDRNTLRLYGIAVISVDWN